MTFSVGIFSFSFLNMYLTAQQDWTQNITQKVKILARLVVRWAKFTFLAAVKIMAANKIHVGLVECFVFWHSKIFIYIKTSRKSLGQKLRIVMLTYIYSALVPKPVYWKFWCVVQSPNKGKMSFFNDSIFFQLDFKLVVYQLPYFNNFKEFLTCWETNIQLNLNEATISRNGRNLDCLIVKTQSMTMKVYLNNLAISLKFLLHSTSGLRNVELVNFLDWFHSKLKAKPN